MVKSGTVVAGPHTRIAFERTSADTDGALLSFEETFQVGPQRPPLHLHDNQTERFTVLSGTLGVRIGRMTRALGPGQTVEVPPGTAHTLWNAGAEACVHRVEMMPALAMEDFFHEIVTIESEGGIQAARLATLMLRHRNQLAGLPWFIQRVVFGLVVLLSPRRGAGAQLTGGAQGVEASVVAFAIVSTASLCVIAFARRCGRIVSPFWQRDAVDPQLAARRSPPGDRPARP